jgi:hypothetical protein
MFISIKWCEKMIMYSKLEEAYMLYYMILYQHSPERHEKDHTTFIQDHITSEAGFMSKYSDI